MGTPGCLFIVAVQNYIKHSDWRSIDDTLMTGDVVVGDGGEAGVVMVLIALLLVAITLEVPRTLDFIMLMFEGVVTRADVLWSVNLSKCKDCERLYLSDKYKENINVANYVHTIGYTNWHTSKVFGQLICHRHYSMTIFVCLK